MQKRFRRGKQELSVQEIQDQNTMQSCKKKFSLNEVLVNLYTCKLWFISICLNMKELRWYLSSFALWNVSNEIRAKFYLLRGNRAENLMTDIATTQIRIKKKYALKYLTRQHSRKFRLKESSVYFWVNNFDLHSRKMSLPEKDSYTMNRS